MILLTAMLSYGERAMDRRVPPNVFGVFEDGTIEIYNIPHYSKVVDCPPTHILSLSRVEGEKNVRLCLYRKP